MNDKNDINGEKGQAILELLVCLIAIVACILGVIFVTGTQIGSIELLLKSRAIADSKAYNATDGSAGSEISDWSYSRVDKQTGDTAIIPFLLNDSSSNQRDNLELFNGTINNVSYSMADESDPENYSTYYVFNNFANMPKNSDSFGATIQSYGYQAANLHEGSGTINNPIITLDRVDNSEQLFRAIEILSNSTIDINKIKNAKSNKSYMPAMKIEI